MKAENERVFRLASAEDMVVQVVGLDVGFCDAARERNAGK
jgi:hypothetical protein